MKVTLARPWLIADLGAPHRILGWALNRPGFASAARIVWREVRDADLTPALDVRAWIAAELAGRGLADAAAMLTSRDIGAHVRAEAAVEGHGATCLATIGLSNAERVGSRTPRGDGRWGTINLALRLSTPLADGALVEALSIAAEARTAAVIDSAPDRPGGRITGTGTDCIIVAAPPGDGAYAGLHTPLGEALGRAVYDAVRSGADDWQASVGLSAVTTRCDSSGSLA